ncbi:hypothetical protein [Zymobacter sp. IVIA_12111.31 C1]|uniref:hypothetical protein n=1 Tax=Zymobacter sp. IVIA_12111.31 C1 TaxID=3394854 RepID=UPI0039C150A5
MKLSRTTWGIAALAMVAALTGCRGGGYYHDRNTEYVNAELTAPLELPATRNNFNYHDAMPVPAVNTTFQAPQGHFEVPRPQGLTGTDNVAK